MPPIGDPKRLNAQGWLDITVETRIREVTRTAVSYVPYGADLLDEIDRLRVLVSDMEKGGRDIEDRVNDALANTLMQEF